MKKRAVFLDRDGVLSEPVIQGNRAYAPLTLDQFRLVEGASGQIQRLRSAGLLCIVFTNQPEVARGHLPPQALDSMHHRLRKEIAVDDVLICVHDTNEGCECHKPQPGMIYEAARKWAIELPASFVIGDRWRDIEAGRTAGCYTVLIDRPYSNCAVADASAANLTEAVEIVLKRL